MDASNNDSEVALPVTDSATSTATTTTTTTATTTPTATATPALTTATDDTPMSEASEATTATTTTTTDTPTEGGEKRKRGDESAPADDDVPEPVAKRPRLDEGSVDKGKAAADETATTATTTSTTTETPTSAVADYMTVIPIDPTRTMKKRKVAVLMGYSGAGYFGMQLQKSGVPTIEKELLEAFHRAGAITDANKMDQNKINWSRAARTDKGVHAAGQLVCAKLVVDDDDLDRSVDHINKHLPPTMRVYGIQRVVKSFDARTMTDKRRYEYLVPAWALDASTFKQIRKLVPDVRQCTRKPNALVDVTLPPEIANATVSDEQLSTLNAILARYVGTHKFHNFTSRKTADDKTVQRYILSFTAERVELEGEQLVRCAVVGQSFILHQIRKMIGLAVGIMRRGADPGPYFSAAFSDGKYPVPFAPGNGLLLDYVIVEAYNNGRGQDREPIDFELYDHVREPFKAAVIYKEICGVERSSGPMLAWLSEHDHRKLLGGGVVPSEGEGGGAEDGDDGDDADAGVDGEDEEDEEVGGALSD